MNNTRHNSDANVPEAITPQGGRGELGRTWTPGDAQGISNRPGDAPLRADADDDEDVDEDDEDEDFDEDEDEADEDEEGVDGEDGEDGEDEDEE